MREMGFKMEREGLVNVGQEVSVHEGQTPAFYYYTIIPAVAMSGNFAVYERLKTRKGIVKSIEALASGFWVIVEFDE